MTKIQTIPQTVAELRAAIHEGKKTALRRLTDHANDEGQSAGARDVCRMLATRDAGVTG